MEQVEGVVGPHEEDRWGSVEIHSGRLQGPLRLRVSGPCSRCSMVDVSGISGSLDCRSVCG